MKPPICSVCAKSTRRDSIKCYRVSFTMTPEEVSYNQRMVKNRRVGPLKGSDWFCENHVQQAKLLRHLTRAEAVKTLRSNQEEE